MTDDKMEKDIWVDETICPQCGNPESGAHACRKRVKPLSELIAEFNPNQHLPESQFVDVASYEKLKQVAVELAKACEWIIGQHEREFQSACRSQDSLTKARSILGGGE